MILKKRFVITGIACLLLLNTRSAEAHDPFETTVTSMLVHDRLEVVVILAPAMGGALVADPNDLEAPPPLTPDTLEHYRKRLEERAARLYEISAGKTALVPERVVAGVTDAGHLKVTLVYPQPTEWPLKFRVLPLPRVPPTYSAELEVFDDDEKMLGQKQLSPGDPVQSELSVAQNPPAPAQTSASQTSPREAAAQRERALALAPWAGLALAGLVALFLIFRSSTKPSRD